MNDAKIEISDKEKFRALCLEFIDLSEKIQKQESDLNILKNRYERMLQQIRIKRNKVRYNSLVRTEVKLE